MICYILYTSRLNLWCAYIGESRHFERFHLYENTDILLEIKHLLYQTEIGGLNWSIVVSS